MFAIDDKVTVLEPFGQFFPGIFTINTIDETTAWLTDSSDNQVENAFDFLYLQKVV